MFYSILSKGDSRKGLAHKISFAAVGLCCPAVRLYFGCNILARVYIGPFSLVERIRDNALYGLACAVDADGIQP